MDRVSVFKNLSVLPVMTLRWRYELDAAVAMLVVIPVHERVHPLPGNPDVSKWLCWVNRAVFQGPEERFRERKMCSNTFPVVCCAQRYVVLSMYMSQRRARLKELDATYKQE